MTATSSNYNRRSAGRHRQYRKHKPRSEKYSEVTKELLKSEEAKKLLKRLET